MKYIKQFEKLERNVFYLIPYDNIELIKLALDKVDMSQGNKLSIIENIIDSGSPESSIYIFTSDGVWFYQEKDDFSDINYYKKMMSDMYNADYKGIIRLSDFEIDSFKYNL